LLIALASLLITTLYVIALGPVVVKCSDNEVVEGPPIWGVYIALNRSNDMADYGLFNVFKDRTVGVSYIERHVTVMLIHAAPKGAQLGPISTANETDLLYIQTHRVELYEQLINVSIKALNELTKQGALKLTDEDLNALTKIINSIASKGTWKTIVIYWSADGAWVGKAWKIDIYTIPIEEVKAEVELRIKVSTSSTTEITSEEQVKATGDQLKYLIVIAICVIIVVIAVLIIKTLPKRTT